MTKKLNILSLSGGGFRGLFTVKVLAELEEATNTKITDHFDLIAGTSIGGIIALALADGHRPADLVKLFEEKGGKIFPNPLLSKSSCLKSLRFKLWRMKALNRTFYDGEGLKSVIEKLFGQKTLKDLTHAYVIVPAARASTGQPKFFKTPHHNDFYMDHNIPVVDAALATSAAPVYFPMHTISSDRTRYLDGGLVGNAPGLFAYIEAITRLEVAPEDVRVLAIGTLSGSPCVSENTNKRPWMPYWLNPTNPRLLEMMFSIQEHQTHNMLSILLRDRYEIIDTTVSDEAVNDIDIDNASHAAQTALISRAIQEVGNFTNTDFYKEYMLTEKEYEDAKSK